MIDEKEIEWWCKEYPELLRDDIIDILEFFDDEINTDKDEV